MRHKRGYRRLNRTHEHRKALFANMSGSLIEHEQIKTTLPKAKELKPIIEKLITLAKRGDLHARERLLLQQEPPGELLHDARGRAAAGAAAAFMDARDCFRTYRFGKGGGV